MKRLIDICNWNNPDSIAIEYQCDKGILSLSYTEINSARLEISDIIKTNVKDEQFIGIDLDIPGYCVPTLMLGISTSGCAFTNLSTAGVKLISNLRMNYMFTVLPSQRILETLIIHGIRINLIQINDTVQIPLEKPFPYAYAVTTSGSTGIPKTVKVSHNCILPNVKDLKSIFNLDTNDVIAQLTNFTFDPSIVEIFLSFSCSSKLFMCSNELKNDPSKFVQVTFIQTTPSLFFNRCMKSLLNPDSRLRILLLGGEPLSQRNKFHQIKHPANSTRIFNIYGITEVSCWASIDEISNSNSSIWYLGETLSDTIFQVRDDTEKVVKIGQGNLYIGSETRVCSLEDEILPRGTTFRDSGDIVEIDENGKIYYQGRGNNTIKRYGNQLNLNEIDKTLMELPYINQSQTIWDESNHKLHSCLTIAESITEPIDIKITKHLKTNLTSLHVPDHIHVLENFHLTSHGKISIAELENLCANVNLEEALTRIWLEHFDSQEEGFVKLGGNSITALQISTKLIESTEREFPNLIGMLLNDCTLKQCYKYITENRTNRSSNSFPERAGKDRPIRRIILKDKYYLEKCIDSSVALFKYRSGEVYAAVGSHSGIICTIELKKNQTSFIKLPDRIQSSILIVNDSKGFVGCYNGKMYCFDLLSGDIVWEFQTGDMIKSAAITNEEEDNIYFGSYDSHVYCLTVDGGSLIWKLKTNGIVSASGTLHSPSLLFATLKGSCLNVNQYSGTINWRVDLNDPIFIPATILENDRVIFCTVSGRLFCFRLENHEQIWTYSINGNVFANAITTDRQNLLVASQNKHIYCFRTDEQPRLNWTFEFDCGIFATPWAEKDYLLIAGTDGLLLIFDHRSGKILTSYQLPGQVFSSPVIHDNLIIVGCRDNYLYTLNIS